ncbi:hypothetical protein PoB_002541100 [Plakobranchus ocellatus]|uniref:Uncharacterized protein n=1 Tax=Plakobranchus ocellatus TaxID=259542 RepID=A0AAV3ZWI8_9GAST|nr:hypothetical protein PoB_002541100 [Plakobranchus ocellatus]
MNNRAHNGGGSSCVLFGNSLVSLGEKQSTISYSVGREHAKSAVTSILSKRRRYSFCFYSLVLRQRLCWIKEGGCHYVTTHDSTDRCPANLEASLLTQIIRLSDRATEYDKLYSVGRA